MPTLDPTRRVAICGINTGCASTNPAMRRSDEFKTLTGAELLEKIPFDFETCGITPVPLVCYTSPIGGPLPHSLFENLAGQICRQLQEQLPVEGVLVIFHGAMLVPGLTDPEGLLLARLRRILGDDVILGASFSRHALITEVIADQLDVIAACRTAPQTDAEATRTRAMTMIAGAINGGTRPGVARIPVPVIAAGEMTSTLTGPCAEIYNNLDGYRKMNGILDASLTIGYPWADTVRAAAAAVVTYTDRTQGVDAARQIAQSYWDIRNNLVSFPPADDPAAQLHRASKLGFAILCDSGDNPSAGGIGDRADLLALIHDGYWDHPTLIAGIAAPQTCEDLANGALQITVGGQLANGGPKVILRPSTVRQVGEDWIVRTGAISIILSPTKRTFQQAHEFSELGLDPRDYRLLVLKCGYPSPETAKLGATPLMALTDGAVSQNMALIPNHFRPKPTWPFDTSFDFCAEHVDVY